MKKRNYVVVMVVAMLLIAGSAWADSQYTIRKAQTLPLAEHLQRLEEPLPLMTMDAGGGRNTKMFPEGFHDGLARILAPTRMDLIKIPDEEIFAIHTQQAYFQEYVDLQGQLVKLNHERFMSAYPFSEQLAAVVIKDDWVYGKVGYMDKNGEVVIPCQYDCYVLGEGECSDPTIEGIEVTGLFKNGQAYVYNNDKNKWGIIDQTGKLIKDYIYDMEEAENLILYTGEPIIKEDNGWMAVHDELETINLNGEDHKVYWPKDCAAIVIGDDKDVYIVEKDYHEAADEKILVQINGESISFASKQEPFIVNNRVMLPLRKMADELHWQTNWNESTQEVSISNGKAIITMKPGEYEAYMGDNTITLDSAVLLEDGVTFIPIRFLGEVFEKNIEWDAVYHMVKISDK